MRLCLLAAAQSHSCLSRWGRHLTVPSAKEYRSRQREADCTRLRWKARAFRTASCIASSVAGSPESGAPFCRSLSMPPFSFCFQGQSTTLYFLKDMKSKILPPKIEKNSKKLSQKIEPPRIWDGSAREICTYSKEMFCLGSSCFAAYRQRRSSDGKRYPAVFHTPSAVMSRL